MNNTTTAALNKGIAVELMTLDYDVTTTRDLLKEHGFEFTESESTTPGEPIFKVQCYGIFHAALLKLIMRKEDFEPVFIDDLETYNAIISLTKLSEAEEKLYSVFN